MKILVLSGGFSNEREVSLRSGANVEQALEAADHQVIRADPADPAFVLTDLIADVDCVFPILHGAGGEDGKLQAVLEDLKFPYLGATSTSSRLAFNKVQLKRAYNEHGILTPRSQAVNSEEFASSELAGAPYVLKPIEGGSSIDTFIVHDPSRQKIDATAAFRRHGHMLLEEMIMGQEITVAVLDETALPIILIIPPAGQEFDYANKYNGKSSEIVNPYSIPVKKAQDAQRLAERIHQLIGLRHMSRTDMIITPDGQIYTLETNTIPGLTDQSLFPKAAAAAGITMPQLVQKLIELTLKI